MIDRINSQRPEHIITIEDPIEFLHRDKKGFVNQREVEVDTANFSTALRAALRQDDVRILAKCSAQGGGEVRGIYFDLALHFAKIRTSSWSAKCATWKRFPPPCSPRRQVTWCFPHCTLWTPPKPSNASSPSSRRPSRSRSGCSWLPRSRPSSASALCGAPMIRAVCPPSR